MGPEKEDPSQLREQGHEGREELVFEAVIVDQFGVMDQPALMSANRSIRGLKDPA